MSHMHRVSYVFWLESDPFGVIYYTQEAGAPHLANFALNIIIIRTYIHHIHIYVHNMYKVKITLLLTSPYCLYA